MQKSHLNKSFHQFNILVIEKAGAPTLDWKWSEPYQAT